MSGSNVALTAILAAVAIVISTVTYIANKRRTSDSHTSLRVRRTTDAIPNGGSPGHNLTGGSAHLNNNNKRNINNNNATTTSEPEWYYAARALRHVGWHSATSVEWRDDVMGLRMIFSPILFGVETEERQAPLVLIGLRYLRQKHHRVVVTIEACGTAETAEVYRESSLSRVRDCAKIISVSTTRIGSTPHPSAEYCYLDGHNGLRYALAVFLTHDTLAVTAQYLADTRVKGVLPTAFNELVRSIQFSPPRQTPSYLLCAEPRLGLGFRLPLEFVMEDQLREALVAPDDIAITTNSTTVVGSGEESGIHHQQHYYNNSQYYYSNNNNNNTINNNNNGAHIPLPVFESSSRQRIEGEGDISSSSSNTSSNCNSNSLNNNNNNNNSNNNNNWISGNVPFAAVAGRGSRRMIVVACYEPVARGRVSWQPLFERHLRTALRRFSVILGAPPTVVWCAEEKEPPREKYDRKGVFIVRPQKLIVPVNGDAAVDDDSGETLLLDGAFCVQEVMLDVDSPCVAFLRDKQQGQEINEEFLKGGRIDNSNSFNNPSTTSTSKTTTFMAFLSVFCLRIRHECVSISFLSSTSRHTLEEFITFCRRTLDTVSVGNHFGQSTSLIYCNRRHEVLPFHILLEPVSTAAAAAVVVEETIIGDPLAIFHIGDLERLTVLLRVFPCPNPPSTSQQQQQRKSTARLEKMVQSYFSLLPDPVRVHYWEPLTLGASPGLEVHYQHGGSEGGSEAESLGLDEEVGHMNPFARYSPPSPTLNSQILQHTPPATHTRSAAGMSEGHEELMLLHTPSQDSREEAAATTRVAVIVGCESCAFVFLAAATIYPIYSVRQIVRQLAANLSAMVGTTA